MKRFARLFDGLDQTTKTNTKVALLADYFKEASHSDRLWAIALLSHKRPKRAVSTTLLRTWASEEAGLPLWLFEESYHIVGDLAEAIALMLPKPHSQSDKSLTDWIEILLSLQGKEDEEKRRVITTAWLELDHRERFIFNKIITGGFRVGISQKLMTRALAKATAIDENILMHRLMGNWSPQDTTFENLVMQQSDHENLSRPYPFYLAYALDVQFDLLGDPIHWQAEYKWDGIRGQLIHRQGQIYLWSRGEDLITERFPEFEALKKTLPDGTVLDGEILLFADGHPMTFQHLQTRIGRKNVTKKILETMPAFMMCYDLLEEKSEDIRPLAMIDRRAKLEKLMSNQLSQSLESFSEGTLRSMGAPGPGTPEGT